MNALVRRTLPSLMVAADVVALAALAPAAPAALAGLRDPAGWVRDRGADTAIAGLALAALWLVALWLGIGLIAAALARLPGRTGAAASRVATIALPRLLQRMLAGSIGLGVVLAPVAAGASGADPTGAATGTSAGISAPALPTTPPSVPQLPITVPAPTPVTTAPPVTATPAATAGSVVVSPGDSLWSIAQRQLERASGSDPSAARIAAEWPRWWAAHRAVVGADPNLIQPGQVLHAPTTGASS